MSRQHGNLRGPKRAVVKHTTSNSDLEHYMKVAGVRPVDWERKWRTTWPDIIRERVAIYCSYKYLAMKGRIDPREIPPKPRVLR